MASKPEKSEARTLAKIAQPAGSRLATLDSEQRQRELFVPVSEIEVPAGAEEITYEPSTTIPEGGAIQGIFRAKRTEEVVENGEVSTFPAFLIETEKHGAVWIRGGWSLNQTLTNVKPGERITIGRGADKPHPTDRKLRIATYRFFRG